MGSGGEGSGKGVGSGRGVVEGRWRKKSSFLLFNSGQKVC